MSEFSLARGAGFNVLCKGIAFGRAQRVGQQAGELLVGGAKRHESASKSLRTGAGNTLPSALGTTRRNCPSACNNSDQTERELGVGFEFLDFLLEHLLQFALGH